MTEAEWFLTRDERGNPSASIDRGGDPGLAWTTGNAVTPLLHGRSYFSRLAEELRTVGSGDAVWILDWRGDADERLDGTTLGELLVDTIHREPTSADSCGGRIPLRRSSASRRMRILPRS